MTNPETHGLEALAPDFELLRPLGEGTMAHVYLAREVALRRLVAIKVLRPEVATEKQARQRFEREAQSAARIRHPNVVAVHSVGRLPDDTPYLIMEYVEGRNLSDLLEGAGPMEIEQAKQVISDVATALEAAHEQGIVHRDVRPGNIMRETSTGRVVLTDFGIAAIQASGQGDTTKITMLGQTVGHPRYMSPEQLMGEAVTEQADIYSLGVTAYELLASRGPYEAKSAAEMTVAALKADPRPLAQLRPEIDEGLASLIERTLAKKPERRPTAADLVHALTDPSAEDALEPVPTNAIGAFLFELRRRRVYRVAAAYAAIAFVVLEGASMVFPSVPGLENANDGLVAILMAGFPVALVLAWTFDITTSGVRKTETEEMAPERARVVQVLLPVVGLSISLLLAALIGWWILTG